MVTWQNRILTLCIPALFMIACGQVALQQPDLISGQFQAGSNSTAPTTKLNVKDYYSSTNEDLVTVDASGTPWTVFLGFSEFLNGDLIETIVTKKNGQVAGFTPVPDSGIIEIWTCPVSSGCAQPTDYTQVTTGFSFSYRPDGGYVPKPDTPVSNFPPPAIAVTFTTALPAASIVTIHVIANKISNEEKIFMAQVTNFNGDKISTPANSPVAGTVLFQTK